MSLVSRLVLPVPQVFSLSAAQRAIIVAGCLGTAYQQLLLSPANVEFARSLGATDFHIGIMNALPFMTLFMQFVAAVVVNHLAGRRWVWMGLSIVHRLIFVPLTLGVWLMPDASTSFWLWAFLLATAVNHAAFHFCSPLWLSWMGDYLPHEGLSQFWGVRQLWMHWSAAGALGISAVLMYQTGLTAVPAFMVLACTGAVLGVVDVFIFAWVEEPPVQRAREPSLAKVLTEPFRQEGFRSFIVYACFWNFATMIAAPFISLYLLESVGLSLYAVLLLWGASWLGGALVAGQMGRLAETFGHRPVLELCTMFKTVNMFALFFLPADQTLAFWILVPVFMLDQILNSGINIASSGFMLKHSPSENRTMYLAAGVAVAGMIGGVTGIACGAILDALRGTIVQIGSWNLSGFHLLFLASTVFRIGSIALARAVQEPQAESLGALVWHLLSGELPAARPGWGALSSQLSLEAESPIDPAPQPGAVVPAAVIHVDGATRGVPAPHMSLAVAAPAVVPAYHAAPTGGKLSAG